MKNFVLPYLLAQASAAEVKHKEAMRADRAMDKMTPPVLTAVVEAPAGTWTDTYIGDTTAGAQKDCSSTGVTAVDTKITTANGELDVLVKAQLATLATSENALMIAAGEKLKTDNADVDTKQKSTTLIANIKLDNEAQNIEYEYKNKWVIAYRAMEAAKAASTAATTASNDANTAESDAVLIVSNLLQNKDSAATHYTAEKAEYDADLIKRDAYKAKWDCYAKQIGSSAGYLYEATCSSTGKCMSDATTPVVTSSLATGPDTVANDDTKCKAKCTGDVNCAAAELKTITTAGCTIYKYDATNGMYTGDGTTGYTCSQRGTGTGWQAKYDAAWTAYKTAFIAREFANSNMLVEQEALVAFRVKLLAAETDVEWIRYAHGPSSLAGMTEAANQVNTKFGLDSFMGLDSGNNRSVYGTKTCSGNACDVIDATAWSVKYFEVAQLSGLSSTYPGKVKLCSGDGTVSNTYYLWGGAFENAAATGSKGRMSTDPLLLKSGSGITLNYANVKAKGGFNIYGRLEASATTTSKNERTGTNSGRADWATKKALLVTDYKAISTLFEAWYVQAETYTDVSATLVCAAAASNIRYQASHVDGNASASACQTQCSKKSRWTKTAANALLMMDKVVLSTATANAQKSCLGISFSTGACTLNYGDHLTTAAGSGAGKCQTRLRASKALLTGASKVFPKLEDLVTYGGNSATGLATKGAGVQFNYDAENVKYWSQHYCTSNSACGSTTTGAGIRLEQKLLMEIEYLKQLQIKMNTVQDAYAKFEIYTDTTLKARELTTTWKGKYDAAVTELQTKNTGLAASVTAGVNLGMVTSGTFSAASGAQVFAWGTIHTVLKKARAGEKTAESNYKDYEKRVLVHKREMDNQEYLRDELLKEHTAWTTTLGVATVGSETGLRLAKATAANTKTTTADTYDKVSPAGKKQLEVTARTAWSGAGTGKVALAVASASAVKVEYDAVMAARLKAEASAVAYALAVGNYDGAIALQTAKKAEIAGLKKEKLTAIMKCQGVEYDKFDTGLKKRVQLRAAKLADIVTLLDKAITDAPKKGKKGWRCEKALSNGTFRPKRGEKTCDTGLCCGAGKQIEGNLVITVETCQTAADKKYNYQPPRMPLATTPPAVVSVDFACIDGAKKLAAAASALAAGLYMMA